MTLDLPSPESIQRGLMLTLAVGAVARWFGAVSGSGLVAGLFVGTTVSVGLGAPGLGIVGGFFVLGTVATRWRLKEKKRRGLAEPGGGARGAGRVLAKGAVGTLLALAALHPHFDPLLSRAAFVGAFAAAAADTVGTEVGQILGRRPVRLLPPGRAEPGTEGAVSFQGTLAALLAAAAVAAIALPAQLALLRSLPWIALGGLGGSLVESLLAPVLRRVPHRGLAGNLVTTAAGAALAAAGVAAFGTVAR